MAKITGTAVASPIVPSDDRSTRPTHYAQYGKGGLRRVATIAALDDIPAERREYGMLVFVDAVQSFYECGPGPAYAFGAAPFVPGPDTGAIYATTTAGLAAVSEGEYFYVAASDALTLYRDLSGVATEIGEFPTLATLAAQVSAAASSASDAETAQTAAEAAQTAAELAETNAETAETNAETAATNATASATASAASADEAEDFRDQARAAADATPADFKADSYNTTGTTAVSIAASADNGATILIFKDESAEGGGYRTVRKVDSLAVNNIDPTPLLIIEGDAIRTDLASTDAGKGAEIPQYKFSTGFSTRSVKNKLDERLSVMDAGPYGADEADNAVRLQSVFDYAASIAARDRRVKVEIPAVQIIYNGNLTIGNAGSETGLTNGRIIVEGAGDINSALLCSAASGDALKITSGKVKLSGFTLSTSGASRSASMGSGNGLVVDGTDGATPATETIAQFVFENLAITGQPGHGFFGFNPELMRLSEIFSIANGGSGFHLDGNNYGGAPKGISVMLDLCRAANNGSYGLNIINVQSVSAREFQALQNAGNEQIRSSGRNTILINPDVEAQDIVSGNNIGILLTSTDQEVYGGLISGFRQAGIVLSSINQAVLGTRFTNSSLGFVMPVAIDLSAATNPFTRIRDQTGSNVTANFSPANSLVAGEVRLLDGNLQAKKSAGGVNSFTVSSATPFSFGDNGGGTVSSKTYFVTLTSNAVITIPGTTGAANGQEIEIVFIQDGTGGRAVTFSGASWEGVTWSNTGNTAGTRASIKFVRRTGTAWAQIGAQSPWV